ncbi:MAG TPA: hypothetical protein VFA45_24970, partial [Actinomycetes bacterium]|nr:hypothetical protein [Actinomycetes bacterium]
MQARKTLAEQPPGRGRGDHPERSLGRSEAREIGPAGRYRPRAAVDEPAVEADLAVLGPPAQDLELDAAKLARRRDQPDPLRQRVHNVSSSMPIRRGP